MSAELDGRPILDGAALVVADGLVEFEVPGHVALVIEVCGGRRERRKEPQAVVVPNGQVCQLL